MERLIEKLNALYSQPELINEKDITQIIKYLEQLAEVQKAVDVLDTTYSDEYDLKKFAKRMFVIFGKDKDLKHQNPCIGCPDKKGPDPSRSPFDDGCYPCPKAEVYDRKVDLFRIHGWLPWLYPGDDKEEE